MNLFAKTLSTFMLMVLVSFVAGCTKPDEPNNGGNSGNDGNNDTLVVHEFVDLGLPSGTLWATCNIGANNPEDCGDYFAWGETEPKEVYDWKSYRYGNLVYDHFELTKYCTDSSYGLNGFVDNLVVLETVDDAAAANWGMEWRMPTKEEWKELYMKTTGTHTVQNGVSGWLFNASNGNSLFLPAAGFCIDDGPICTGLGTYWSSSLHTEYLDRGWSFHFDSDECHVCGTYERSRGQVVRAVRVAR